MREWKWTRCILHNIKSTILVHHLRQHRSNTRLHTNLFHNKLCGRPPQYAPAPCKLTFDLESAVQVTCDVGYLCAKFGLSRPLFFRLRPDVRDRQTDRQTSLDTHHRLMRPPYGGGDIIKTATVYYDYYLRVLLNQTISGDHCRSGWSGVSKQDPLAIAGQLEGAMSSNQPCHSSRAIVITEPAAAVLPLPPPKKNQHLRMKS